jgi:hypothetical protein
MGWRVRRQRIWTMRPAPVERLPPAARCLIDIARHAIHCPSTTASIAPGVHPEELRRCASRHGLTAWLPDSRGDRIRIARSLAVVRDLLETIDVLDRERIRAIALKGPVFSAWLYGDPGAREPADLDLLVDPRDRFRTLQLLNGRGYVLPSGMSTAAARVIYGSMGAWPLSREGSLPLDVHWRLAHRRFASPVQPGVVMRDAVGIEIAGRRVEMPCPTHTATIALTHAAKHLWCSLELVFAIARLMQREDVDWETVCADAKRGGACNAVAAGVRLAAEIFAVEVPVAVRHRNTRKIDLLCEIAYAALAMPSQVFHGRAAEWQAHRAAFDRGVDRVRHDAWRVLAPTVKEWEWCRLPDSLVALYVPLRLVRLAACRVRGD